MPASNRRRAAATADSFAHLAGLGRGRPLAAEEDPDDKKQKDQAAYDEECAAKEARGEDAGETEDEKKERAARKAKSAKAEDPDDDGDDDSDREEMHAQTPEGEAFRRGIARCAAIFASPAAGRNPVLAAQFAFDTGMTRGEATRALRSAVAAMPRALHGVTERAAGNPNLGSGASAGAVAPELLWDKALAKAGVKIRHA